MNRKIKIAVMMLFLVAPGAAEPLENDFFRAQVPPEWTISRDTSGLWELLPGGTSSFEKATLLVNRLRTSPELYLQGTARLWSTKGEVEVLEEASKSSDQVIVFLIRPKAEDQDPILKFVRWQDDLMVIASFTFPLKHLDETLQEGVKFADTIELKEVDFRSDRLISLISERLGEHENSAEELAEPNAVRTEMASFRQDWEPYFPHYKPALYTAFLAYLEARFDASFAQVNGPGLGMPPELIESRFQSVENRKKELLPLLDAPFDPDEGSKDSL